MKKLIELLKSQNIPFRKEGEKLIINGGDVYLPSPTTLPEGVKFNNGGTVDLFSLTTLPKNTKFNNGGYVVLRSLTTLPKGVKFNNGGSVDLRSLTTLPKNTKFNNGGYVYLPLLTTIAEGVKFNNGGYVDLFSLTTLPKNTKFNNGGYVYLSSLTTLPEGVKFNNGGDVYLSSLTTLPEDVEFNNGGSVDLKSSTKKINTPYLKRFGVREKDGTVILYKRVSGDFKTQENTTNETSWLPGTKVEHPAWNPGLKECGKCKFHACARPHWGDIFRNNPGDRYIAVRVPVSDLYEWKDNPSYPQKIGFRRAKEIWEVDRKGRKI